MSSFSRAFVHTRLSTDLDLTAVVGGRAFQQGSIITSQSVKPYLVHHFGNASDEGMADEDSFQPKRQYLQVYIHVPQGDYGPIDDLEPLVRAALASTTGRPKEIIAVQYLETSQDLQDDLLQTYFRYLRFQIMQTR